MKKAKDLELNKDKKYNTTDLDPEGSFERHIFHRDQFAHYIRWTHVLREAEIGMNILDVGCGKGELLEVLYRNRFKPKRYLGLDIRKQTIDKANERYSKLDFASFQVQDLAIHWSLQIPEAWDIICSFEVMEHVNKKNGDQFLKNIYNQCQANTIVLISTPCYDERVGAAQNHIYDGAVQEYTYHELKELLSRYFTIEKIWGTFASTKDYKPFMNDWQKQMYDKLYEYYDANLLSNLMAPFFPEHSRNCLWKLRMKPNVE